MTDTAFPTTPARPATASALARWLLAAALLLPAPLQAQVSAPSLPSQRTTPSVTPIPSTATQGTQANGQAGQQVPGTTPAQGPGLPALNAGDMISTSRIGSATAAEGGPVAVGPIGEPGRFPGPATVVFGSSLFTRGGPAASDTPNPNYTLLPGDRVSITVWGFVEASIVTTVDAEGNVFIPQIGPVRLAGVRAGDVQRMVETEVRRVYSQQVQVYAVLLSAGQVGVFVTGQVRIPGRHLGSASESVLDYLARAGGVDPGRGSYRDITVTRGGRTVARIDLYRFLLSGELQNLPLQQGDTIIVPAQGAMVGADGAVRNNFLFEVTGRTMPGSELIRLASPLPSATNAVIRGTRNSQPFSRYTTLRELAGIQLMDQDVVTFITDAPPPTVRVSVEGSRIGPSVLITDRDVTLCTVLDYIAVDPNLANTRGIFLLRPSVAAQQARMLNEAMDRLERQLFLTVSPTTGVAEVRASEAQLVSSYISRARRTRAEGRLVVMDRGGRCADVRLEDGDIIVIPERVQTVLVSGEVTAPQAVIWRPNLTIQDYIRQAGGLAERGGDNQLMIRRASGELILEPTEPPQPGDELIALPRLDPKNFQLTRDLLNLIFQSALSAQVFTGSR
ncbi:polysaccharide biosynthesis/export family protein [Falsiroseomonas ponticola]|jgi:protein involved in polysaccharide export with SLBB domain|uniref:polysaccharide biosynthesis/export family protein n=1 Tax=Falsiroseomonas ponticola TaxID=2786951 RepID=UPI001CF7CD43|nr:polysaccharide biosynthesis/export family protein [Roseomonas ponticola]